MRVKELKEKIRSIEDDWIVTVGVDCLQFGPEDDFVGFNIDIDYEFKCENINKEKEESGNV